MATNSDPDRKPVALFGDLDDLPVTPAGERNTEVTDKLAEDHGFDGGAARPRQPRQGRAPAKRKPKAKKPTAEKVEVRRIGRPRTGRDVRFSQSVHPGFANAIYDHCRRSGSSVVVAMERSLRLMLEEELSEAKRRGVQETVEEIEEALESFPKS